MRILAIESSAKAASVAYCEDGELISQYWQNSGLTHSRTLLVMASDLLKNIERTVKDVDVIAVAMGPGSFTGIRIGVAAAKGLAWGADLPVRGVSTLEAMANHIKCEDCVICPVMDARRSQVYNAKFEYRGGELVRLCPDRAVAISEVIEEAKNDGKMYFLVGDGAKLCYNYFLEAGVPVKIAEGQLLLQSAWGVAQSALKVESTSPDDLIPNYIRPSQAERERLAKIKASEI